MGTLKLPKPPDPFGLFGDMEEIEIQVPPTPFPLPFVSEDEAADGEEAEEKHDLKPQGEEDRVLKYLEDAFNALRRRNPKYAKHYLVYAKRLSTCNRCIRNIAEIQRLIDTDRSDALRRLKILIRLIPSYYYVIENEKEITSNGVAEEECGECDAAQIIDICGWDPDCMNAVIGLVDDMQAKGLKVRKADLINEAIKFRRGLK